MTISHIALSEAIGFKVKHSKCFWGKQVGFLGLLLCVNAMPPTLYLPEEKRIAYQHQIRDIITSGRCSRSGADSIFGRLQFCEYSIFGRTNRIFLIPIYKRKYAMATSIGPRLSLALRWFAEFLEEPQSRIYRSPVFVYPGGLVFTDASEKRLGVRI